MHCSIDLVFILPTAVRTTTMTCKLLLLAVALSVLATTITSARAVPAQQLHKSKESDSPAENNVQEPEIIKGSYNWVPGALGFTVAVSKSN